MGLFSQNCLACGHPVLMPQATTQGVNEWMSQVVSISPEGDIHVGEYDGYGRVGGAEYAVGTGNSVWHRACWEVAGKPMEFKGESEHARDQGWFFGDDEHLMRDPRFSVVKADG